MNVFESLLDILFDLKHIQFAEKNATFRELDVRPSDFQIVIAELELEYGVTIDLVADLDQSLSDFVKKVEGIVNA